MDPQTVSQVRLNLPNYQLSQLSGMSDQGMGIRLFNSKETLQNIFEGFDDADSDDEEDIGGTSVITSQLRHFVIQVG